MTANGTRAAIRVSILAIMIFQVCALFARSALDLSLVNRGIDRAVANDLSYLVVPPLLAALMYPYLRRNKDALFDLLKPRRLTRRLLLGALLLGLSLRATYWALLTVLMWTGIVGNADPNAIAGPILGFACPPPPVLVLSFLTMSLLVPLVEEVVNRGLLLHTLLPMGFTVSVAGSAFLFALAHQPGTYIAAFATGILLAIQTLNARTLWAPLVTHGTYNLAATIDWDCFRIIWNPPASDPALAAVTKIAAPAAVAGIVLCCWLVSKKAIGDRTPRLPGAAA